MMNTDFILRTMELSDLASAMKLSGAEGWNQTEKDWKRLVENPANICKVAERENKVIGTATAMNYSNQVAWIGMVLVDKEFRGRGISKILLTHLFGELKICGSVKLDATPRGQKVYKELDFKDEYSIVRMISPFLKDFPFAEDEEISSGPVRLKQLQEVIALDRLIFGADRTQLIESLVNEYSDKLWLLERNNSISGFALGRDGNKYHQIGPVMAGSLNDAKRLVAKALKKLVNQPIVADVPCDKEEMISWLNALGFIEQRRFTRMYRGKNPFPGITGKQYLICGPEFG
jgi:ribosomal protein S18 acetylase RimI-like enzyme